MVKKGANDSFSNVDLKYVYIMLVGIDVWRGPYYARQNLKKIGQ